ncbi:MAG: REP-associated tyrosine transposase [Candidatus Korobacteraceae bacterium]
MAIPYRGTTFHAIYFVTAGTAFKKSLLQSDRMAGLFCKTLFDYRDAHRFQIHAFVVMPNHFHIILTVPEGSTLERAMQFIKGGFSFQAGKQFGLRSPIWQKSFVDRRVRDSAELEKYRTYIHQNSTKAGMVGAAEEYRYSSANPTFAMDELPQRPKPGANKTDLLHR